MDKLRRFDRMLTKFAKDWVFLAGFSIWLLSTVATTTLPWLFLPGELGKIARYLALATVIGWYLIKAKAHPAALLLLFVVGTTLFFVTRSTRMVKYCIILAIPLCDFVKARFRVPLQSWVVLVASVLLMIVATNAESPRLVDLATLVLAARGILFKKIATTSLVVISLAVAAVFLACSLGIVGDYVAVMDGIRFRYFMGFSYALYPSRYLFIITCLTVYLAGKHLNGLEVICLLVANLLVYRLTDSRLTFCCAIVVIFLAVYTCIFRANPLNLACIRAVVVFFIPMIAVFTIALHWLYNPSVGWMAALNRWLGSRLSLGHNALLHMGVPLLGQHVELVGNGLSSVHSALPSNAYNFIDSLYVQLLVEYGPLLLALHVFLQICVVRRACNERQLLLVGILVVFAAQGVIDDAGWLLQYNTFLMLISGVLVQPTLSLAEKGAGAVGHKLRSI